MRHAEQRKLRSQKTAALREPGCLVAPVDLRELALRRSVALSSQRAIKGQAQVEKLWAVDSNVLTYLTDVLDPEYCHSRDDTSAAEERIAVLRLCLFVRGKALPPTVRQEYEEIPGDQKKKWHEQADIVLFHDLPRPPRAFLDKKVRCFMKSHSELKDCTILTEVEFANVSILLSNDDKFINRLRNHTQVCLCKPSIYWKSLNIPRGSKPVLVPGETNPLSSKAWWHW